MKRTAFLLYFSVYFVAGFAQVNDPVIMRIGNKDIAKSEFEYSWNKNNTNSVPDKKSLDEYVNLYVNFKLKVAEAEAQGIDTTSAFKDELKGYRRQLIEPYFIDKDEEEALVKEAYDRIKEYVEISNILLKVEHNASPKDTLKVYQNAMNIYQRAVKGENFANLAKQYSEDEVSKKDDGYLGFFTGCNLLYPLENAAYETPVGGISKPVRTQTGYNIVEVHSRRPALGQYNSSHIFKAVSLTASPKEQAAAKDTIFKIYDALKNGGDFKKLAIQRSDERVMASRNGAYGMMLCGSLPIEYEKAVFSLKVGEYSAPFHSKYGWHIVKALEFRPYPSLEKMREKINSVIAGDERAQMSKKSFIEKMKKAYNYTFYPENLEAFLKAFDVFKNSGGSVAFTSLTLPDTPLFTLGGKKFTQNQFFDFMVFRNAYKSDLNELYSAFVTDRVRSYEDTQLDKKYPEFGHLMQEYRDGILLFDVSNKEVWEKASNDTVGLKSFFINNKSNYIWAKPHYRGFVIQCANASVARQAKKIIKKLPADSIVVVLKRTFNTDSTTLIKVDRGLFEQGENADVDALAFKKIKLVPKAGFPEVFIKGYVVGKEPETYTDVYGLVTSDYQNYLETKWLNSLKGKYKVVVYKDVVNTVNKN
jgi:peptidyl-prolyl cis-trans isomerase SurA